MSTQPISLDMSTAQPIQSSPPPSAVKLDMSTAQPIQAAAPQFTMSAVHEPDSMGGKIAQWAQNVSHDIKYGTDLTGVGTVLKKMGAHGVYSGNSEAVGDFMASLPLGLSRMTQGGGEVSSGQVAKGAKDIGAGALQAATIPASFVAPEAAEAAAAGAGKTAEVAAKIPGAITDAIPSTKSAGAALQEIKSTVGDVPIDTSKVGDSALELYDQAQRGATLPSAVNKLIRRITTPGSEPLTYAEAKDFQSNISSLSANEKMSLKPNQVRLLGQLNSALKSALADAADTQGKGEQFTQAMREYHNAMKLQGWTDAAISNAWKLSLKGAGLYGVAKIFGLAGDHSQ